MIKVSARTQFPDEYVTWAKVLNRRTRAYQDTIVYTTAQAVLNSLYQRMPTPELRKSLEMVQVRTGRGAGYLIRLVPKTRKMQDKDTDKVLLTVQSKQGPIRTPKRIKVLEDFGPWTASTIPFRPDPRYAVVVEQRASQFVVKRTELRRRLDKRKWTQALQRAGGVDPKAFQARKDLDVITDLNLLSMSYEFGLGVPYKPHWRPAILKNASQRKVKSLLGRPKVRRILQDPSYRGWKKWPPASRTVPMSEVKKYDKFQKTLGIL